MPSKSTDFSYGHCTSAIQKCDQIITVHIGFAQKKYGLEEKKHEKGATKERTDFMMHIKFFFSVVAVLLSCW